MPAETQVVTKPGDLLIISSHHVGDVGQTGEILEVLGTDERPHYRVRWDDGRESVFFPGSDAIVQRKTRRR